MPELEKGTRVRGFRPHDRSARLAGTVEEVRGDEVLIASEPDGVMVWIADASPVVEGETKPESETASPSQPTDGGAGGTEIIPPDTQAASAREAELVTEIERLKKLVAERDAQLVEFNAIKAQQAKDKEHQGKVDAMARTLLTIYQEAGVQPGRNIALNIQPGPDDDPEIFEEAMEQIEKQITGRADGEKEKEESQAQ